MRGRGWRTRRRPKPANDFVGVGPRCGGGRKLRPYIRSEEKRIVHREGGDGATPQGLYSPAQGQRSATLGALGGSATLGSATLPLALAALLAAGCASSRAPDPGPVRPGWRERGVASWYGPDFHGRPTASGEVYDMHRLTAAHRTLPFGTVLEVRNLDNGRTVMVRVNDRGPFIRGRILDLSFAAAQRLAMIGPGTARVEIFVLPPGTPDPDRVLTGEPRYTVQVGAFLDPERARRLEGRLAQRYGGVTVRSDGTWHRVQVGDFDDRGKAEKLRARLARDGYDGRVVVLPGSRP